VGTGDEGVSRIVVLEEMFDCRKRRMKIVAVILAQKIPFSGLG
jgi:hypothetical protein